MTVAGPGQPLSFPRQEAVTRRFRLGQPRGFRLSPDGERACFIRSASGRDPVGSLWAAEVVDGQVGERLIVDARAMVDAGSDLPPAEKARRERLRETTSGITAFSADSALRRAVFSLDGVPYSVDLVDPDTSAAHVAHPGPVVDPQQSPDGAHVAYVSDRALYLASLEEGAGDAVCLAAPESGLQSWGLADFVAAEEFDRVRGLWWLETSDAVLAEFVDETAVEVRWICDPAQPQNEPTPHRYPVAGAQNPQARLFHVLLDGARSELTWDRDAYPYLTSVETAPDGGAVVAVLSRDQQRQLILGLAAGARTLTTLSERRTSPWVSVLPGVPSRAPDGTLLEIIANLEDDCFQLVADGRPLSPPGTNVHALIDADKDRLVVVGTSDPMDQHVLRIRWNGDVEHLTRGDSVNSVAARGGAMVITTASAEATGTRCTALLRGGQGPITSMAERPVVDPQVAFLRVGERRLSTALLWPTGHVPGSAMLPVILAPYGGPHHARVVHAASGFAQDQWLADQGFAVVVIDGVGTPGRGPDWEFGVHGDLAGGVLADQVSALQDLGAIYPDLDLDRVGITGWSFGGYLAGLALLERPDVFRAAVAGAPVSDWRLYDTAYSERYLGLPQDAPAAYDGSSLLTRAAGLERPLLIIHGLADDNVLAANTLQLSSALLAAGRSHAVLPLSGVTHMTPQEVVAENLMRLEVEFFTTHLC